MNLKPCPFSAYVAFPLDSKSGPCFIVSVHSYSPCCWPVSALVRPVLGPVLPPPFSPSSSCARLWLTQSSRTSPGRAETTRRTPDGICMTPSVVRAAEGRRLAAVGPDFMNLLTEIRRNNVVSRADIKLFMASYTAHKRTSGRAQRHVCPSVFPVACITGGFHGA